MSKILHAVRDVPVSQVSGLASDSCVPMDPCILDPSITAGMVLRRAKKLPEITSSESFTLQEGSTFLLKSLFTSILEDVRTQLLILERCNTGVALIKTLSDIDYLKAVKYGVYDPNEVKDELDGIDVNNLNCSIYKIKKLDADRKYVDKVMSATYVSLAESFTFEPLVSHITAVENLDNYRINLMEEESKNKILRKELRRQVRQQRNHIKTVLYDTDVIIDKLRTQVEDSVLYAEVSNRYMDDWQRARTEQHKQKNFDIENEPSTKIECYKQRTDHELRVHTEIETLVSISITEKLEKIEQWMDKFDKDMEKIDLKIQIKKNKYKDKRDKNIGYEEMLKKHDVQMTEWMKFKKDREIARMYYDKMMNSAIIVQAWWRGLLVRLHLGPHKLKKHKKEKKKLN